MGNPNEEVKYPQYTIQARVKDRMEGSDRYTLEELEEAVRTALKGNLLLEVELLEVKEY